MAELGQKPEPRWRDEVRAVIVVALQVVLAVMAVAALAIFVPPVRDIFARLPIAIMVLVGGTAWVLWRITRGPASG